MTRMKNTNRLLFVLGLLIFSYTCSRAFLLSFTWDESFSYLQYVRNGVFFPEKFETMGANNHLLNTWLNIYLVKIFGVSEFVLRVPSLIAHVLFLFFSFKLVKDFQNGLLVVASFLIINTNPYLLDFFSLSRGYGLSMGLMMTSIYFLYAYFTQGFKIKHAIYCCLTAALATLASFVILNYFLVVFGIIFIVASYNTIKNSKNNQHLFAIAFSSVILLLTLWFLIPTATKLKEAGALFYGGNKGFWVDTVCTVIDRCFYEVGYNNWFQRITKGAIILIIITAGLFLIYKIAKKQTNKNNMFLGVLFSLLILSALSTIVQHSVFGTLYLIDRTAIFLVVLFSLVFVFFINELTKEKKQIGMISYLVGAICIFHFVLAFNLRYVLEWKWDADIKQMIVDLDKIKEIPKEKKNVSIAIPLEFDQGINFYRAKNNLVWLNTVERSDMTDMRYDYLFFSPEEFSKINMDSIEVIKRYPITNNVLAKPKLLPNLTKVGFSQMFDFEKEKEIYLINEKTEYSKTLSYKVNDSITPNKSAEVVFSAIVKSEDVNKNNLYMVISFENSKGTYVWKTASIKDYIIKNDEWNEAYFSVLVPKKCMTGDELKCYIWNPNKHKVSVKKMELKWLVKP